MTTRTVGGTVTRADGTPIASAPIVIELVLAEAFVVTGSYSMGGTLTLQTAANGTWSTPLQCNDDLTPVGTLYQITEKIPSAYGGAKVYLIQVLTGLSNAITNQVGNLLVPAAVPVGGTYSPITVGPPGTNGTNGLDGYIAVADNAALNALTPKTTGRPIWVVSTGTFWVWNGTYYEVHNFPRFTSQANADTAFNAIGQHKGQPYYLQSGAADEGVLWRNSNNSYTKPWNMPWGMMGLVMGAATAIPLTGTPAAVLSLANVPLRRNRQYLFSHYSRAVSCSVNNSLRVTNTGFTPPTPVTNTTLCLDDYTSLVGAILGSVKVMVPFTVTADANYTIGVSAIVQGGTGSYWTDSGGNSYVADLGPSGAPL